MHEEFPKMLAKRAKAMRGLVLEVGGSLRAGENRKAWLARIARTIGVSPRMTRSAWEGSIKDPEHKIVWKLQRALEAKAQEQEAAARNEIRELTERLAILERRLLEDDAHVERASAD
jgi:hypothetical protein